MDSRFSTPRNNVMPHPTTDQMSISGMAACSYSRIANIPPSVENFHTPQSNCTASLPFRGVPSIPPPSNSSAGAPVGAPLPAPFPLPPSAPVRLQYDENDGADGVTALEEIDVPLPEFVSAKSLYEGNDRQMKYIFSSVIGVNGIESIDDDDRFREVAKNKKFKKKCSSPTTLVYRRKLFGDQIMLRI